VVYSFIVLVSTDGLFPSTPLRRVFTSLVIPFDRTWLPSHGARSASSSLKSKEAVVPKAKSETSSTPAAKKDDIVSTVLANLLGSIDKVLSPARTSATKVDDIQRGDVVSCLSSFDGKWHPAVVADVERVGRGPAEACRVRWAEPQGNHTEATLAMDCVEKLDRFKVGNKVVARRYDDRNQWFRGTVARGCGNEEWEVVWASDGNKSRCHSAYIRKAPVQHPCWWAPLQSDADIPRIGELVLANYANGFHDKSRKAVEPQWHEAELLELGLDFSMVRWLHTDKIEKYARRDLLERRVGGLIRRRKPRFDATDLKGKRLRGIVTSRKGRVVFLQIGARRQAGRLTVHHRDPMKEGDEVDVVVKIARGLKRNAGMHIKLARASRQSQSASGGK